jgi:hypothetical protein
MHDLVAAVGAAIQFSLMVMVIGVFEFRMDCPSVRRRSKRPVLELSYCYSDQTLWSATSPTSVDWLDGSLAAPAR